MLIEGSKILALPRAQVWRALNDPAFLQTVVPGCRTVSEPTPGNLQMALTSSVGPIKVNFDVGVQKRDIVEPESYVLEGSGSGGPAGSAKGRVQVRLRELEGGTQLDYSATTEISGRIAQLGSRMINSTARKFSEEFFANVAKAMHRESAADPLHLQGSTSVREPATHAQCVPAQPAKTAHPAATVPDASLLRLVVDGIAWRMSLGCAIGSFVGVSLALAVRAL